MFLIVSLLIVLNKLVSYIKAYQSPVIDTYVGYYAGRYESRWEYYFKNETDNEAQEFHMTFLAKKKIYSDDFSKDEKYIIHYEVETRTIVDIEKIE